MNGLAGGRGSAPRPPAEPRARIRLETARELPSYGLWWYWGPTRIDDAGQLVVPWSPRALAAWLIEHRAARGSHPDLRLTLTDDRMACVWLLLAAPDDDTILRALADPEAGRPVAAALQRLGREQTIATMLARGDDDVHRHLFSGADTSRIVTTEAGLAAAVHFVLHDPDQAGAGHVGARLMKGGERTLAALAAELQAASDAPTITRGLAVLCQGDGSSAAATAMLPLLGSDDRDTRHRALYVLGLQPVPPALRAQAAQQLFSIVTGKCDRDTRLLAFDALAQCAEGVDAEQRRALLAMLEKPPVGGIKARTLGCLRTLGEAAQVPLATKAYIATTANPTTATWLALADEGEAAAEALVEVLTQRLPGLAPEAVAQRLAETAPQVLRTWLCGDQEQLQRVAGKALRALEPESGVATAELLVRFVAPQLANDDMMAWLAARDDVGDGAAQVYAWMNTQYKAYSHEAWREFASRHPLPTPRLLELLAPQLRQGHCWDLLGDDAPEAAHQRLRECLLQAGDATTRSRLEAAVARRGVHSDEELAIVLAGLDEGDPAPTLRAVGKCPTLQPVVRRRVEQLLDGESYDGYLARLALLAHPEPR